MLIIKIYGDAPFEACSGNAKVLQSGKKEIVHHLVLSRNRLDEFRMGIDMLDQTVGIFAHFEEICFLFCGLYFSSTVRTFAVLKLGFRPEGFAGSAVHSFVSSLIDIALVVQFFENLLYLTLMIGIGGTDEFVIRSIQAVTDRLDFACHTVHKFLRGYACFCCFQLNFLTVLIGSGLEKYIVSFLSLKTCNGIRKNDFVRISDMRFSGSICNCSCNIIRSFVCHFHSSLTKTKSRKRLLCGFLKGYKRYYFSTEGHLKQLILYSLFIFPYS